MLSNGITATYQTNVVDVDKHMMTYIETEMRKRRGSADKHDEADGASANRPFDPYAELYVPPEHLRIEEKEEQEGSMTRSSAMLTQVQEVDLGIDARLRNIEQTERAKRQLLDDHDRPSHKDDPLGNVPNQRFFRYKPEAGVRRGRDGKVINEAATDEAVADRFRKWQRR
ncbi:hepatocellular carcinoma-associated antigen 59-domain-containing protein [Thamnocephalis sphaerospora]|uniref:Hepatocellular carcinoma-associated antigen 59-domain-containing protein n=1 Tax=Thamnocephalis sphaerospora TaxID=78915 RepID=A0A4P9XGE9_9FUNG|nr:hepatocellular carcinoma-associated antigen 59-domain-containing protein [Thamnocephalis sphaerospora]|eukprot:RKP04715.1 hepatocellular carcinoma-associated antigen 59-domain-containing protein [Thamnocephalis sphaerospora]